MSFVLDALKLSERRRSRFSRRVYAHPPRPRRAGRMPSWLVPMVVLAGLALVVVLGWRMTAPASGPTPLPATDSPATDETGRATAPPVAAAAVEAPAIAMRGAAAAERDEELGDSQAALAVLGPGGSAEDAGLSETRTMSTLPSGVEPYSASEQDSTDRLLAAPPPDWPALSLQMLFFSEDGTRSFVQLNGKTYKQGEQLVEGPKVEKITQQGVMLGYRGQQVLLGVER